MKVQRIIDKLQAQLLVFPALVVLMACVSFAVGGHCASWQWWISVVSVLALPFCDADRRNAIAADVVFILALFGFWVMSMFVMDYFGVDHVKYHFPATGMLIEGWNPLYEATPEAIKTSVGLDCDDMCWLQVLFMHKAVWIFNAIAYLIHKQPLAVSYAAGYFIFCAVAVSVLNLLKGWNLACRIALVLILFARCYFVEFVVDAVVALSVFALMVVMAEDLYFRRFSWLPLVSFSFWSIGTKASGMLACAVCWCVFSAAMLWRCRVNFRRWIGRFAIAGMGLVLLFIIVCSSPYISAWRNYGHPLYPMCTVDAEKYPIRSMAGDFLIANDDWKAMGPIGFLVNAYVSPKLTKKYYNMKLGRNDFRPVCATWIYSSEQSPTKMKDRIRIWFTLGILLCFVRYRVVGVMAIFALAFVPPYLYGLMRYFWWMQCLMFFSVLLIAAHLLERLGRRLKCLIVVAVMACATYLNVKPVAAIMSNIRHRAAADSFAPRIAYCQIYPPYQLEKFNPDKLENKSDSRLLLECHGSDDSSSGSRLAVNNAKLLARRWKNIKNVRIIPTKKADARQKKFSDFGFYIDK